MMSNNVPRNDTKHTRLRGLHNLDLMSASFTTHAFPRHYHETYVIEVIEEGRDDFYCGGQTHTANTGDIVFINPYEVHTGRCGDSKPLRYRSFYPSPRLLSTVCGEIKQAIENWPHFPRTVVRNPELAACLVDVHRKVEEHNGESSDVDSLLFNALSDCVSAHAHSNPPAPRRAAERKALHRARSYIITHFDEQISLRDLTKVSGLSTYYLLRSFRAAFGITPYEFLINLRVEHAKQLLAQGQAIAQVAYDTGFYDQSHLNKHFKRLSGFTSGQYR